MRRRALLVRHAKSAWDDPTLDDHDRPLAPRGRKAADRLAAYVGGVRHRPDVVLCSSARRTVETLEAIRPVLPETTAISVEPGLYLASADTWLRRLHTLDDDVACAMAIGHNPGLGDLVEGLAGSGPGDLLSHVAAKFPTGAVAAVSFEGSWAELVAGCARLDDLFEPRPPRI